MKKENYKIILKTIGPVHIGCGSSISKREYIYDYKTESIMVFDPFKMFRGMEERGLLKKYEIMLKNNMRLDTFFDNNNISRNDYEKWKAYNIKSYINDEKSPAAIESFVKDPYGMPYIPGSSLKGALRTVILSDYIKRSDKFERYRKEFNDIIKGGDSKAIRREIKRLTADMETCAFNTLGLNRKIQRNAVNDIFRGIVISDSKPLKTDSLIVCEKKDIMHDGKINTVNIVRECLRPGTEIEFDVSVNKEQFKYSANDIKRCAENFFDGYLGNYITKFKADTDAYTDNNIIVLGGGAGFLSKTVVYSLFDYSDALDYTKRFLNMTFKNHKHLTSKEVSPKVRKCTDFNAKLYDFGVCGINFAPIKK